MRKAFSIAELMIVAAIIGILAALCVPYLHNHAAEARATAAKDNVRVLRDAIKFYAVHHGDTAPGYEGNDRGVEPTAECFLRQMIVEENYLRKMPSNPFNDLDTIRIIKNDEVFPSRGAGDHGWIYQPATETIRVDWPGKDTEGVLYMDY
jgi:general secretion pathway protein G